VNVNIVIWIFQALYQEHEILQIEPVHEWYRFKVA